MPPLTMSAEAAHAYVQQHTHRTGKETATLRQALLSKVLSSLETATQVADSHRCRVALVLGDRADELLGRVVDTQLLKDNGTMACGMLDDIELPSEAVTVVWAVPNLHSAVQIAGLARHAMVVVLHVHWLSVDQSTETELALDRLLTRYGCLAKLTRTEAHRAMVDAWGPSIAMLPPLSEKLVLPTVDYLARPRSERPQATETEDAVVAGVLDALALMDCMPVVAVPSNGHGAARDTAHKIVAKLRASRPPTSALDAFTLPSTHVTDRPLLLVVERSIDLAAALGVSVLAAPLLYDNRLLPICAGDRGVLADVALSCPLGEAIRRTTQHKDAVAQEQERLHVPPRHKAWTYDRVNDVPVTEARYAQVLEHEARTQPVLHERLHRVLKRGATDVTWGRLQAQEELPRLVAKLDNIQRDYLVGSVAHQLLRGPGLGHSERMALVLRMALMHFRGAACYSADLRAAFGCDTAALDATMFLESTSLSNVERNPSVVGRRMVEWVKALTGQSGAMVDAYTLHEHLRLLDPLVDPTGRDDGGYCPPPNLLNREPSPVFSSVIIVMLGGGSLHEAHQLQADVHVPVTYLTTHFVRSAELVHHLTLLGHWLKSLDLPDVPWQDVVDADEADDERD